MTQTNNVQNVLENLEQQKSAYGHLMALVARQLAAISGNDDEDLFKTVDEKNKWIQSINLLETEAQQTIKNFSQDEHLQLAKEGEALKESLMDSLNKLIELEQCAHALKEKRTQLHDEILNLKQKKNLIQGYGDSDAKGSRFSDSA